MTTRILTSGKRVRTKDFSRLIQEAISSSQFKKIGRHLLVEKLTIQKFKTYYRSFFGIQHILPRPHQIDFQQYLVAQITTCQRHIQALRFSSLQRSILLCLLLGYSDAQRTVFLNLRSSNYRLQHVKPPFQWLFISCIYNRPFKTQFFLVCAWLNSAPQIISN